jgi:hypothetical protein
VHPDWLGSPQHFIAAALLAGVIAWIAPRVIQADGWVIAALAVGAAMTGEVLVEVAEYPLRYADDPNPTAYLDTVADLASSLIGAVVGALGVTGLRRIPHRNA